MREMRRKDRLLDSADVVEILKNGEYGVLATVTEDGSPYSVPMSYAFDAESHVIYDHPTNRADAGKVCNKILVCQCIRIDCDH